MTSKPNRKPRTISPLVPRKKPGPARPRPQIRTGTQPPLDNGETKESLHIRRLQHGGWSQPPPPGVQTFPVFTTKRSLRQGFRYHVMKFTRARMMDEERPIDPCDQEEFTRPVTLHRRDPRQLMVERPIQVDIQYESQVTMNTEDAEKLARSKAEREAQRAIDQSKIAPTIKESTLSSSNNSRRQYKQREEKTTINRAPKTEQGRKESDLRYEEALPWHLEDADGKNIWVGNYVSALSEANMAVANVAFVIDRPGFRMIPLEKWYKFTAKPPFTPFSLDEAETLMGQKTDIARWAMRDQEKRDAKKEWADTRTFLRGPAPIKNESLTFRNATRAEKIEHDEIDMSGDEFQDDDEAPAMEVIENDDERDVKARVRRDQLGANLFGDGDEQEVDREEREELREKQSLKTLGKKLKKALVRREHDIRYKSDSSGDDPFDSSSDDTSSSDEVNQDDKNQNRASKFDHNHVTTEKDLEMLSHATPGRNKFHDHIIKAKTLKRTVSPTISESSGNESSRKRVKNECISRKSSVPPNVSNTLTHSGNIQANTDNALNSPVATPPLKKIRTGIYDRDDTRPQSGISNSLSPSMAPISQVTVNHGPILPHEIISQLPPLPAGATIANLMKSFQSRVGDGPGQTSRKDWIKLVKANTVYGQDKLLRRKEYD